MSVIVWDGKTIAADRQGTCNGTIGIVPKLFPVKGYALGVVGYEETGLQLVQWFKDGADPEKWPSEAQLDEEVNSLLIVAGKDFIGTFFRYPVFCRIHDDVAAWGSGREIALGAMAMGADAVGAVDVVARLRNDCGRGVDIIDYTKLKGVNKWR